MSNENDLGGSLQLDIGPFRRALGAATGQIRSFASGLQQAMGNATRGLDRASRGTDDLSRGLRNANNETRQLGMGMRDLERIVGGILLAQAFYGIKSGIENATVSLARFMSDMEKTQIALEYFLATPTEAKAFLADIQDFAASTAFNTAQAAALSRKLMAAQFNPNDVIPTMTILNDAASAAGGTAEQMDRIVLALTQIKTNGKLAGQEMRQLAEAGIPIYKILQEELNLTGKEIMNVGDLQIPGEEAVAAVLRGLEKRYKGAADRIADTMAGMWQTIQDDSKLLGAQIFAGPYEAMKRFLTIWRDTWDEARTLMFEGGLGRAMEEMIPQELWTSIRAISGSLKSLGRSFVTLLQTLLPIVQIMGGGFIAALGIAMPIIAGVAKAITQLAYAAIETIPGLKYLVSAILGLLIAQGVAKVMMFFWGVLRLGAIAGVVSKAVDLLSWAIMGLSKAILRNPVVAGFIGIGAAVLYFTGTLQKALGWIDALINRLAGLGGFDIDLQLPNKDTEIAGFEEYTSAVGHGAESAGDAAEEAGKDAAKAAKEFKKFTAAFDEVYQIPDQSDSGSDKGKGSGGPKLPTDVGLGDMFDDIEIPEEIELPKLRWPSLEDIQLPPIVGKIINGTFQWPSLPPFPPFPPLPQLEWSPIWANFLAGVRGSIPQLKTTLNNGWISVLEWAKGLSLPPIGIPIPDFGTPIAAGWAAALEATTTGAETVGDFLGETLSSWGVGAATAFATMGASFATMWKGMKGTADTWGRTLSTSFSTLWTGLGIAATAGLAKITAGVAGFFAGLQPAWASGWDRVKTVTSGALSSMKGFWDNHKTTITVVATGLLIGLATVFSGGLGGILAGVAAWGPRVLKIFKDLGPLIGTAIKAIPGKFTAIWESVTKAIPGIITAIVKPFKDLPSKIGGAVKGIPGKISEVFGNIKLPSFSSLSSGVSATFNRIGNIAGFATGGIIGKDSIVRVGEQGKREAIIPLQNASAMKPFVDAVVAGIGGSNQGSPQRDNDERPILYVGNLIADERGLRELEQRMEVIRNNRGGRKA